MGEEGLVGPDEHDEADGDDQATGDAVEGWQVAMEATEEGDEATEGERDDEEGEAFIRSSMVLRAALASFISAWLFASASSASGARGWSGAAMAIGEARLPDSFADRKSVV